MNKDDTHVFLFTKNYIRYFCNPDNLEQFKKLPNAVINPDLSLVDNVKRKYWKLKRGKVVPMEQKEQLERNLHIQKNGIEEYKDLVPHQGPITALATPGFRGWIKKISLLVGLKLVEWAWK
jgi:hypothetical protein